LKAQIANKTATAAKHVSRLLGAVHETAQDLHRAGVIDKRRMHEYDALCLAPAPQYSSEQIRSMRQATN
jgi:putative transcriptional regulator